MEIFGVYKNGIDAQKFCQLSKEEKRDWILKRTPMRNETMIEDFLNKPMNNHDCDCGCGGNKQKNDSNISIRSAETVIENQPEGLVAEDSSGNNPKRPKAKRRKNNGIS